MLAGTERVVSNKLNWLANHGYEVALVTYEQGSHPLAYELHPSIRVTDLDVRFFTTNRLPLYQRYIAYRRMKRLFRQRLQQVVDDFRPDIIMTTTYSLKIADEILKVKDAVEERRPELSRTILTFHLDQDNINRYKPETYEAIFHH